MGTGAKLGGRVGVVGNHPKFWKGGFNPPPDFEEKISHVGLFLIAYRRNSEK